MSSLPLISLAPAPQVSGTWALPERRHWDHALDDVTLLQGIAQRQEMALRVVYERYGPRMQGGALRALNNLEDAQEIVQDWLVKVWENAGTYDVTRSEVATWLTMICRGLVANKLRGRKRRLAPVPLEAETSLAFAAPAEQGGDSEVLSQILQSFSPAERRYLDAAVFSGLTQEQVARQFAEPLGTVKTRTRRALEKLKTLITQQFLS